MNKKIFGAFGEEQASLFLKKQNYLILERNFQTKFGEIDIIAKDGDTLVFVEVKSRDSDDFGDPLEAITKEKKKHLAKSALHYLAKTKVKFDTARFDVISLLPNGSIDLIKDAFEVEGLYVE